MGFARCKNRRPSIFTAACVMCSLQQIPRASLVINICGFAMLCSNFHHCTEQLRQRCFYMPTKRGQSSTKVVHLRRNTFRILLDSTYSVSDVRHLPGPILAISPPTALKLQECIC